MVGYFIYFSFLSNHKTLVFDLYLSTKPYISQTQPEYVINTGLGEHFVR